MAQFVLYKHVYIDTEYFDNFMLVQQIYKLESLSNIQS